MTPWIDGGYAEGDLITTSDGLDCRLLVSLGSLGWVAEEIKTKKKIILLFEEPPRAGEKACLS